MEQEEPVWLIDDAINVHAQSLMSAYPNIESLSKGDIVRLDMVAMMEEWACPLYIEVATHLSSYYIRLVADLPCTGHYVQLMLHVHYQDQVVKALKA